VCEVPPEEIVRGSFATMSFFSISLILPLLKKEAALSTIHQPQASRWCTHHQWVMKYCSWKDYFVYVTQCTTAEARPFLKLLTLLCLPHLSLNQFTGDMNLLLEDY
jgi:hypothetical protein